MATYYIGVGSNISPREKYLRGGIETLEEHPAIKVTKRSSIYETDPVGYTDQPSFLNMVIQVETLLIPKHLYAICMGIEGDFARERTIRWGPRTLDLDILLYSEENIKSDRLIIPHPRMHERPFVLIPLLELAPPEEEWTSLSGKTISELVDELPDKEKQGVKKWEVQAEEENK